MIEDLVIFFSIGVSPFDDWGQILNCELSVTVYV